jgi:xylan 1,4-beta-xylosidase
MFKKHLFCLLFSITAYCNLQAQYFTNPVLAGFYPDPSICAANGRYYLVNSTFSYFPGLPVFESKDLVNWTQIGNAIDRKDQLPDLKSGGVSRGLFAPAIRYHKGIFYITCTLIDKGGNFVITATNPAGPWSKPVWTPAVHGIDPSLFFDDDKAYIIYNSDAPDHKAEYDGHRTIQLIGYDIQEQQTTGQPVILVNKGSANSVNPIWIEGPHIYKKDGWYYLTAAEGGTGYNHSQVVFRSKNVSGPYESFDKNPILTQRHLDKKRPYPITTVGHADFVQAPDSSWYAIFLGCRPYDDDYYNTGRETFMAPVQWIDGWPVINPDVEAVQYRYPISYTDYKKSAYAGTYVFKDSFKNKVLDKRYLQLRISEENWYQLLPEKGLSLATRPSTVEENGNPSFIGFRQGYLDGVTEAKLDFAPINEKEQAGLIVFQSEKHYYFFAKTIIQGKPAVALYKSAGNQNIDGKPELIASQALSSNQPLLLRVTADKDRYHFSYSLGNSKQWASLAKDIDTRFVSTRTAGGFVGVIHGMYTTSNGQSSGSKALFQSFMSASHDKTPLLHK